MMAEIWAHVLSKCLCCRLHTTTDDAGCCGNKYTTNSSEEGICHTDQTTWLPRKARRIWGKKILFSLLVKKRKMKLLTKDHTEAKYGHGIMCKAWNNLITEKAHQPSNTFKAEKYIFWSCPGRLMQWCKIMWVCRTAMKIQFKIQFKIFSIFFLLKRKIKSKQPFN